MLQTATDPSETAAALAALSELAENGHRSAQAELARAWQRGIGVAPDPAQAVRFWAADQGHSASRNQLARALQSGAGTTAERDMYRGRVNGRLTERTILAIAQFCREEGIGNICRHGQMRSDAAQTLGQVLFPRSGCRTYPSG